MIVRSRFTTALALAALAAVTHAEIRYSVTATEGGDRLQVEMRFDAKGPVKIQMPNWAPGAYVLSMPAKNVQGLAVTDGAGKSVDFKQENDNTWTIDQAPDRKVTVRYSVPFRFSAGSGNYSGPPTYFYVVDRKAESCRLDLRVPGSWKIATGLDPVGSSDHEFVAPDYDVLADSPVTLGDIRELRYEVKGRDHLIALYGAAKDEVDADAIIKACKFVSTMQTDFMKGIPYKRYVWHFSTTDRYDGAGGLEHLNSTQIGLASGVGPRAVGVCSHEFFHLWNVKRIRSKPLGPFDYNVLPKTGALWWLEGVTDYYAHTLLHRYGWTNQNEYFETLVGNVRSQRSKPGRLEVSPYQASYRVGDAANGRGNSTGFQVSYYDTGWLAGMCLDIEILAESKGKRNLDDVEYALWNLCKDSKPGFEEDEIRKQCVRLGGDKLGPFYDRVIMKAGELPIEEQLAKVGLQLVSRTRQDADLLVNLGPSREDKALNTRGARGDAEALYKAGDLVVAINGRPTTGDTVAKLQKAQMDAMEGLKPGETVTVSVKRGSETVELKYKLGSKDVEEQVIQELEGATAEQKRLRGLWLKRK